MVQLPSAPSDSGNRRSTSARALLRDLQHHAGLAGHGVGGGIDLADLVQPPQRDNDLAMMRGLAADQAGIAALRHQRDFVFAGELADRGHFRRRAGPQHQRRAAVKQVAFLGDVGRDIGGIGHRIFVADNSAKFCDQFGRKRRYASLERYSLSSSLSFPPVHSRPTAARRSRSLMASPNPSSGIGITAMVRTPLPSSARRWPNRLAAASRGRRARTNSSPRRRRQFPKLLRGRTPAMPRRAPAAVASSRTRARGA